MLIYLYKPTLNLYGYPIYINGSKTFGDPIIPLPSAQRSGAGLPPPSPPLQKWFISWEIVKYGT